MKTKQKKYFIVYQITNLINSKIYIGIHATNDINDNYFGSGTILNKAIKKYGKQNFNKEVLYIFDEKEKAIEKEAEIVNEDFIKRKDTYNVILGGDKFSIGYFPVKDKNGEIHYISVDNEMYLSGEFVGIAKGLTPLKDDKGNYIRVPKKDLKKYPNYKHITEGLIPVKDKDGNIYHISKNDSRYLSGELSHITKDLVTVKDQNGNTFSVSKTDKRFISGELVGVTKGLDKNTDLKNKIIKLRKQKFSYKKIVEELGCSESTVVYYCKKNNLNDIGLGNKAISFELQKQIKEYCLNHTTSEAARKFNVSLSTVRKYK